jgi:hypothetical protein
VSTRAAERAVTSAKRAEDRQVERLRDTFVDSGVSTALESIDSQILYGRRGTGKTHALLYLAAVLRAKGDLDVYVDLRTIGSPQGLFLGEQISVTERASRLLVDLLNQVHDSLLEVAFEDPELIEDANFVNGLDALANSLATIRVAGEVEVLREGESRDESGKSGGAELDILKPALTLRSGSDSRAATREATRETRRGTEEIRLNFADIATALRQIANSLKTQRIWLLLDEWVSVPAEVQPYLAEFLVRCVLPLQPFTVKIAAIEQQSQFRMETETGQTIGFELGADLAANVNLDDFMVFEQNEAPARDFFRGLLFKHLTMGVEDNDRIDGLNRETDLIRMGFTDRRAFDELVRAAECSPRCDLHRRQGSAGIRCRRDWRAGHP